MAEEDHKILTEDEIKDQQAIKGYKEQYEGEELAKKLTEYFTKKYGPEFRGSIIFEYDDMDQTLIMKCEEQTRIFDIKDELMDIPSHIRILRKK